MHMHMHMHMRMCTHVHMYADMACSARKARSHG